MLLAFDPRVLVLVATAESLAHRRERIVVDTQDLVAVLQHVPHFVIVVQHLG